MLNGADTCLHAVTDGTISMAVRRHIEAISTRCIHSCPDLFNGHDRVLGHAGRRKSRAGCVDFDKICLRSHFLPYRLAELLRAVAVMGDVAHAGAGGDAGHQRLAASQNIRSCHEPAVNELPDIVGAAADTAAVTDGGKAMTQVAVSLCGRLHYQLHGVVGLRHAYVPQEGNVGMQVDQTRQQRLAAAVEGLRRIGAGGTHCRDFSTVQLHAAVLAGKSTGQRCIKSTMVQ